MLRTARAEPSLLVIGIDADMASMRASSRKAADRRTGVPNAVFVVSAVEGLPSDLAGVADHVTIHFPWGSLLRGLVTGAGPIPSNIARTCRSGANVSAMWSITERDVHALELGHVDHDRISDAFAAVELEVQDIRPATPTDVAAVHSSWAKRLRAGIDRPATVLRATRR